MASGNLRTKSSSKFSHALIGAALLLNAFSAVAQQPAASTISAGLEGVEDSPLHFSIQAGPLASTAWGVGFALGADFINLSPEATGFYEGGFLPHIEIGALAFSGTPPLYQFSLGAQFYTNQQRPNVHGLRNAWIHGYREVFRNNAVFLEGNFLGLIPFYFSGFHWRFPWGAFDLQWTPVEFLRGTRDLMSFAATVLQSAIQADWERHLLIGRVRAGGMYLGWDGLNRTAPGPGFTYGAESEYQFKASKRVHLGARVGIEGGLASVKDSSTGLTTGWSTFGFQSHVFVLLQF